VNLPRLGLGTAPLGGLFAPVAEADAIAVVERALAAGIRLVDTAPLYGYGVAEERVGRVLAREPRESFLLSTKVGRLIRPGTPDQEFLNAPPGRAAVFDFGYDGALRSLEESLERLGLDRVDIVLVHDPDDHVDGALAGAVRAVVDLRDQGVVGAVGVGVNRPLSRFVREADLDCVLLAGRHTLLDRSAVDEFLPLCLERGVSVIAGGVFNSGVLAEGATFDYAPAGRDVLERVEALRAVCERHGVPLKAAALQFPLRHPAVTTVLTGVRSVAELEENVRLFALDLPADLWAELE
jgi:D-threo-aldose 1-dehydrogenase